MLMLNPFKEYVIRTFSDLHVGFPLSNQDSNENEELNLRTWGIKLLCFQEGFFILKKKQNFILIKNDIILRKIYVKYTSLDWYMFFPRP